jgi:hypothetical protein
MSGSTSLTRGRILDGLNGSAKQCELACVRGVGGFRPVEEREKMKRNSRYWRLVVAALAALAISGAAAAPAPGSTWTGRQLTGEAGKVMLFGMSCPTTSFCVAAGGNNTIASSTNPGGGLESWKVVYAGLGALPTGGGIFPGRQIRGVSCPSPQLCVAVTFEGLIYASTNPTGDAGAWNVTDVDGSGPNTHFFGVSCPTASFCAAAAGKGKIATTTNPTGGASAWTITQLEGPLELRGISCVSSELCVAVGDDGEGALAQPSDAGEVVSSTSPLGGVWQKVQMTGEQGPMFGISCPSAALCVTGNLFGNLVTATNPTGPASAWKSVDGGGAVQITDVDCLSTSECVAVDNNADVLTSTNPTGGASDWTFTNVLPYPLIEPQVNEVQRNAMFGVSCPAPTFCAIGAAAGQIFTSTDPFTASPAAAKGAGKNGAVKKGKKNKKKGPKRPRVRIATPPQNGLEFEGKKVAVRTFFYAANRVQVRGFVCKLDKHPVRRCHSPKVYRVGVGRHVFRVRAIGSTGLRGPAEVAHFRTCHPTPYPNCFKHLPAPIHTVPGAVPSS